MHDDSPADQPTPPRSVAAMWMFGLLFFVLVIVPVGLVIYILIDSLAIVAPTTPGNKKPSMPAILIGLSALALGLIGVFALQWILLKTVFAKLTAEGELTPPAATNDEESNGAPPKPL